MKGSVGCTAADAPDKKIGTNDELHVTQKRCATDFEVLKF